jgi:hypothetical protein
MIKELLDAYAAASTKIWSHDRSKTIGASEIGQCARRICWIKNKQKPDSDYTNDWGASVRGTVFENQFWEPALRAKYGNKLLYAGKDQISFISDYLSATPDGLITGLPKNALKHLGVKDIGSDCVMAECKTSDPRTNLDKAKTHNVYQTQVQMGLVREKTKYKPNYSLLSYTNASFWDDVTEFVIPFDISVFKTAKQRAETIINAKHATDLKPEGWIAGGAECRHCPFTIQCGIERRNLPFAEAADKPIDPQKRAEIMDMCLAANALDAQLEINSAKLREQQDAIKTRLREMGIRKIKDVVSWTDVKGRISFDDKALREAAVAAGVNIEKFSKVGQATDRLTIHEIKSEIIL